MRSAAALLPLMQKAVSHHKGGRFVEAERGYLSILDLDPTHADALGFLGALYIQHDQPDRAVTSLQKALKLKADQPELLNNLGVALYDLQKTEEAMASYRQAIRVKPDYYDAINNLGNLLYEQGQIDEALPLLEKSLRIKADNVQTRDRFVQGLKDQKLWDRLLAYYTQEKSGAENIGPDDLKPLMQLGNHLRSVGRSEEALKIYDHLMKLAPRDVNLRLNFGTIFHDIGRLDDALTQFEHALSINPASVDALVNRGGVLIEKDRPDEARLSYDQALHLQPQSLDAQWGKALACLALGDYDEGWSLYETGFARPRTRGVSPFEAPRWDGRAFPGQRLLIWGEQGLGDVLQFIRYAALCKERGGTVTVMCREPLVRLLKNCPYIDSVVLSATERDFDYHVPVMSLPHIFGTTLETVPAAVPYLNIQESARQKWAPKFAGIDHFKVGLVWAGNPRRQQIDAHVVDRRRSMSLDLMAPLFTLEKVSFFSLQKGDTAAQIDECRLRGVLTDYMPETTDFLDTAAIIDALDLVISVDTSVVHLAGALGKPVWVLSRFDGCWRWLRNRETSPWYPTARVFGQPSLGDWQSVIEKVAQSLRSEISSRAGRAHTV